jgi:small subunit ribosomal protein S10
MKTNNTLIVYLKSFSPIYLNRFVVKTQLKLKNFVGSNVKEIFLPKKIERFTVLKSPHVDKKAREQFERITYKRTLYIDLPKNKDSFFHYRIIKLISSNILGVQMRIKYISS